MQSQRKSGLTLCLKAQTWKKDSHSLFDYQSHKIHVQTGAFSLKPNKMISVYRKKQQQPYILITDNNNQKNTIDLQQFQLLTKFIVGQVGEDNKVKLQFCHGNSKNIKPINSQKLKTEQSISSYTKKQQETYIVVRRPSENNMPNFLCADQCKGYFLNAGQSLKFGRMEYYISQICINGQKQQAHTNPKTHKYTNGSVMKLHKQQIDKISKQPCKICLTDIVEEDNFMFRPCKCISDGFVHFKCLFQWIKVKVKKQIVGGTAHYNFENFQCQICKGDLPTSIEYEGKIWDLLPLIKPTSNYMILQSICQKYKSLMVVQNVPTEGIKFGRSHDCQIRITDISVSRNHALLKFINNKFIIFDNKSKFGTLIRQDGMSLDIGKYNNRCVQIGRTMITFELKNPKQQ